MGFKRDAWNITRSNTCKVYVNLEYHPHDSRVRIANDDICQTLTNRMGTGGNNVPMIIEATVCSGKCRDIFIEEC